MGWIILSSILFIGAFVGLGFYQDGNYNVRWKINRKQLLSILAIVFMIPAFFTKVPANSVGIMYSPFGGTSENTLSEGYHVKNPFEKVYVISTEVQTTNVTDLTTQTKDAQYLTSNLDIKYRVDSSNAYLVFTQFRTLDNMSSSLIVPTTQRVLELITTKYNVIDVLGEDRTKIYIELEENLRTELAKYGIEFYSISITDMDAGDEIENAITQEAVAKKAVETAKYELQKAETEAKKQSVTAQAEQDAASIRAETKIIEAEAERQANELLNQTLTDEILMQQFIEKWNGELPTYYGGESADLIFNTNQVAE